MAPNERDFFLVSTKIKKKNGLEMRKNDYTPPSCLLSQSKTFVEKKNKAFVGLNILHKWRPTWVSIYNFSLTE